MESIVSSDLNTIQSMISDPPTIQIYKNYMLGSMYAYGVATLGVELLAACYQRQIGEDKSGKRVALNAICPGMERGDKSPEELVDTVLWLAVEQPSESAVKGEFVADRKVIDHFVIIQGQEMF